MKYKDSVLWICFLQNISKVLEIEMTINMTKGMRKTKTEFVVS